MPLRAERKMKKKLKFVSYWKYSFSFTDEDGNIYYNEGDGDDIYRFNVKAENEAELVGDVWYLDGLELYEIPKANPPTTE